MKSFLFFVASVAGVLLARWLFGPVATLYVLAAYVVGYVVAGVVISRRARGSVWQGAAAGLIVGLVYVLFVIGFVWPAGGDPSRP